MNHPSLVHTERKLIAIFLSGAFLFLIVFEGFFLISRFLFEERISRTSFLTEIHRIEKGERFDGRRGRGMGPKIGISILSFDRSGSVRNERGPEMPLLDEESIPLEYISDLVPGVITKMDDLLLYKHPEPEELGGYKIFIRTSGYPIDDLLRDIFRFLMLDFLIIFPFYFMGRYFVRKTLLPVEENINSMSHFIHDAGHELKTPLAIISGNLQILREKNIPEGDLIEESIKTIHDMSESLDGLLELSNVKKGETVESLSIKGAFEEEIAKERVEISKKNIQVHLQIPEGALLNMDRKHFSLLFGNLLRNAITYNRADGAIDIEYKNGSISLKDTGRGIEEKHLKKIWDRFYRVEKNGSIPGSGIGLSIVEKIVNLYGWKIAVSSKKGVGTTFSVQVK